MTTLLTLHGFTATIVRCGLTLTVLIILIILTLLICERPLYDWMLSILIPRVIASTPPCGEWVLLVPDAATPTGVIWEGHFKCVVTWLMLREDQDVVTVLK